MTEARQCGAEATVRFAIFDALVRHAPRSTFDHLERLADIAAEAVKESATAWAFVQVAEAAEPRPVLQDSNT